MFFNIVVMYVSLSLLSCRIPATCTVILAAATRGHLARIEADFKSSMKRLCCALKCERVLYGAGHVEIKCIRKLSSIPAAACSESCRAKQSSDYTSASHSTATLEPQNSVSSSSSASRRGMHNNTSASVEGAPANDDTRKVTSPLEDPAYRLAVQKEFQYALVRYLSILLTNNGTCPPGYESEREVWRCVKEDSCFKFLNSNSFLDDSADKLISSVVLDSLPGKCASFRLAVEFLGTLLKCRTILRPCWDQVSTAFNWDFVLMSFECISL